MRLFVFLSCCLLTADLLAADKEIEGERKAAQTACPTPEEARAKMSVPEGYEVRCFAHEPMVQNPVAMTWDHRGRLWVVEAYEYPEGSNLPAPFGGEAKDDQYHPLPKTGDKIPRDRVIILEDTDNNGEADKRTVFVEGLNLASAILCGDNGIYIGQQPHLIHFRDADDDDKPDAWRVVLTGFGREDTHELVNSFCWGPDGWLSMTHGVFTNSKVRRPGQPEKEGFKFDAGIGRARPMRSDAGTLARKEVQAGVQEVLPGRPHGQAVHRGGANLKGGLYLRDALHWLRYLRQEVPL
jgi:glucose/arabinose dehydrogenase